MGVWVPVDPVGPLPPLQEAGLSPIGKAARLNPYTAPRQKQLQSPISSRKLKGIKYYLCTGQNVCTCVDRIEFAQLPQDTS